MAIRPVPTGLDPTHTADAARLLASGRSPGPPTTRRIIEATVLALLSVQCLYYNSVLLLAIAAGAMAVAIQSRAWHFVHYSRHRHAGGRFVATLHPDDAPDARVDLPCERSRWRFLLVVDASLRGAGLTQSARRLVMARPDDRWPSYRGRRLGNRQAETEAVPGRIPPRVLFAAVTLAVGVDITRDFFGC